MSDATHLEEVLPTDPLGRYIPSRRRARKAANGDVPYDLFQENIQIDSLSVDRLDLAPDHEMAEIAMVNLAARDRPFFGWAAVTVEDAQKMGRTVEPTPMLNNRYHADIYLNLPENSERKDAVRQHALNLARHAVYRPWPPRAEPE